MAPLTRRTFLALGCGAACAHALGCGPAGGTGSPLIAAGPASSYPVGTLRALAGEGVGVGHDSGGTYALSLICTHQGCDISVDGDVSASGIQCFCHGAQFDAQGNVLAGPARARLVHFAVTKDAAGLLTVHTDHTYISPTATPDRSIENSTVPIPATARTG